jgi:hypothetical protein
MPRAKITAASGKGRIMESHSPSKNPSMSRLVSARVFLHGHVRSRAALMEGREPRNPGDRRTQTVGNHGKRRDPGKGADLRCAGAPKGADFC